MSRRPEALKIGGSRVAKTQKDLRVQLSLILGTPLHLPKQRTLFLPKAAHLSPPRDIPVHTQVVSTPDRPLCVDGLARTDVRNGVKEHFPGENILCKAVHFPDRYPEQERTPMYPNQDIATSVNTTDQETTFRVQVRCQVIPSPVPESHSQTMIPPVSSAPEQVVSVNAKHTHSISYNRQVVLPLTTRSKTDSSRQEVRKDIRGPAVPACLLLSSRPGYEKDPCAAYTPCSTPASYPGCENEMDAEYDPQLHNLQLGHPGVPPAPDGLQLGLPGVSPAPDGLQLGHPGEPRPVTEAVTTPYFDSGTFVQVFDLYQGHSGETRGQSECSDSQQFLPDMATVFGFLNCLNSVYPVIKCHCACQQCMCYCACPQCLYHCACLLQS